MTAPPETSTTTTTKVDHCVVSKNLTKCSSDENETTTKNVLIDTDYSSTGGNNRDQNRDDDQSRLDDVDERMMSSKECMLLEDKYGAHNYHPMPVVISRGEGIYVYDVEGKCYMDFLSAYSACNQGHCHPKIINTLIEQSKKLTLTSRAFYNDQLGLTEKYLCDLFHYDKCLMMNSGAEAVETSIKLARRWGYDKKNISKDCAIIITAKENFHGRTTTICSFSTDPECYNGFGPMMPGFINIEYNNLIELEDIMIKNKDNICAFLVEPIQGEAGAIIPSDNYLLESYKLCKKYNCLLICDEIQTGLGRSGNILASYGHNNTYENKLVRPDIICLGKALSGGIMPISCVLCDDEIMLCIKPGQHGSTFGGNPLACSIVRTSINVLLNENMISNSNLMGQYMKIGLEKIQQKRSDIILQIRGRGLMLAMVIKHNAWNLCCQMLQNGLLCKPTHENIIRLSPPLIINQKQIDQALQIIEDAINHVF